MPFGDRQPHDPVVVDTVFLAEHRALPFAGLGEQVAPGDVLVLRALEAVIECIVTGLVVEVLDEAVAQRQAGEQGEVALGDAEGHVGPGDIAPFGQDLAAAIDDAGMAAARRHRAQYLVVGGFLA